MASNDLAPMELVGVRRDIAGNIPVLFLRERTGERRLLPIYIGQPEGASIQWALDGRETTRPLSHDLIVNLLGALGAVLEKVVITEVNEGIFFAELHLQSRSGQVVISSRPSDAIAIAVRAGCTIYCEGEVLDIAGKLVPQGDEFDDEDTDETDDLEDSLKDNVATDDLVDEFRDFIDSINPEDFQP
jgi:bifunctional DNase/RNase